MRFVPAGFNMKWYAIYTKPKREKVVVEYLSRLEDIEILNPIAKVKKFHRKKLALMEEELFPSYLFARFDFERYYHTITYTRGVKRILKTKTGVPFIVDPSIIDSIRERIVDGFVLMDPPALKEGDAVSIKEGPLKGFMGVFLSETKPLERVTILLDTLTYQARVEVDRCLLVKE